MHLWFFVRIGSIDERKFSSNLSILCRSSQTQAQDIISSSPHWSPKPITAKSLDPSRIFGFSLIQPYDTCIFRIGNLEHPFSSSLLVAMGRLSSSCRNVQAPEEEMLSSIAPSLDHPRAPPPSPPKPKKGPPLTFSPRLVPCNATLPDLTLHIGNGNGTATVPGSSRSTSQSTSHRLVRGPAPFSPPFPPHNQKNKPPRTKSIKHLPFQELEH